MLIRYAEDARSEYVYLNVTFKSIVMLVPNCVDNRNVRLEVKDKANSVHGVVNRVQHDEEDQH
jgi:hypothetical protein